MTADNPRIRPSYRRACAAGLFLLLALSGCKSKDGGGPFGGGLLGGGTPPSKQRDPLVHGPTRIPPQNVPLPERGIGAKGRDPLTTPAGKSGTTAGAGYSDDPERFKGTFIPGSGSTPAALSAEPKDGDELKIDDNRVPLRPAGALIPAGPAGQPEVGAGVDALFAELEKYGVKREGRTLNREDGQYVFRASMPWGGATRAYTGVGATANEAVKQVLDQVVADRK